MIIQPRTKLHNAAFPYLERGVGHENPTKKSNNLESTAPRSDDHHHLDDHFTTLIHNGKDAILSLTYGNMMEG